MPNRKRRFSLRRDLTLLVLVCVIPAALISATLAYSSYSLQRQNVEQQTHLLAQSVMADVEREMASVESVLKVLASSQELGNGDLRAFHQRARDALGTGIVNSYVLTDARGKQLLNTLQAYGVTLPSMGTPPELGKVFTERRTVVSSLFVGPVSRKMLLAMGVPVGVGDRVEYSLNIGLEPHRLNEILAKHSLPEGWLVAVLDSKGVIIARSRDPERFVGQPAVSEMAQAVAKLGSGRMESVTKEGIPAFSAFVTSPVLKWTVVVGAPKATLTRDIYGQMLRAVFAMLAAIGAGLWLARKISMRVLTSVRQLNDAALSLGRGEDVRLPAMQFTEADAVSDAMLQAGQAMQKVRFYAQHDVLTELPNRLLFDEVAERDLAYGHRKEQTLALLAIDLDGFKAVNDTLGHAAGDHVLKVVADRIRATVRASDIAGRIGGDEFLVLLTDINLATAMDTAQRIVALLSEAYPGVQVPVTASVGVALFPTHGASLIQLASSADRALYAAKHAGKCQAVLADSSQTLIS